VKKLFVEIEANGSFTFQSRSTGTEVGWLAPQLLEWLLDYRPPSLIKHNMCLGHLK
jgi:hypothetical protein